MNKPDLGDTVINRYTLVSRLRDAEGLQAWKASDRVLARDYQLFIVNDADALPKVNAIASSLALSRNPHFTRVLQLQHRDSVAVIITALDAGLSLTSYLAGQASHTLSFEAIRTIIGESARAEQQLLVDGISHQSLSTDTIRITSQGVQLADAPISPLLTELSKAPVRIPQEQLATRQLAGVLYSLLVRKPLTQLKTFDLDKLELDVPGEFRLICARGLNIPDKTRQTTTIPMVSLSELTALLGSWTPLTHLHGTDVALPGIDGENSIVMASLARNPRRHLLNFPDGLVSTTPARTLPTSVIFPIPTLNPSSTPDVPGIRASSQPVTSQTIPDRRSATVPSQDQPSQPVAGSWRFLWDKGRSMIPPRAGTAGNSGNKPATASGPSVSDPSAAASAQPNPDFHDVAAKEMKDIISTPDTTTVDSVFPSFSQDQGGRRIPMSPHFDFAATSIPRKPSSSGIHPHPRTESTGSIPVFGENGHVIIPGDESLRALQAEQKAKETAGNAGLPPSFTPRSQQTGASQVESGIANAPLFSRFTTKVVSITLVAIVVVVALAFALRGMTDRTDDTVVTKSSGAWPEMNLNNVPFGSSESSGTSSSGTSSSTTSPNASSSSSQSASSSETSASTPNIVTADRNVSRVPTPSVPENNTAFDIDKQEFLTNPSGQEGFGYYMHLSQEQTAQRFVITIRSSGGTGYLYANTSDDPSEGEQVAKFTFDSSGTTDVKFTKPVKAQDFLLWVPIDSLPNNQLYINSVKLY